MPTASNEVKPGQLFCVWFTKKSATEQNDFMWKLRQQARYHVRRDDAGDLAQLTWIALWTSPHLYEDIGIELAFAKMHELAPLFWRRRNRTEPIDADNVVDLDENPLEAMIKREAEREAKQASESAVERMRKALSATQNRFVDFNLDFEQNLPSDEEKGPFRSGPKRMQFDNESIARHQLPAEIRAELSRIEERLGEINKISKDEVTKKLTEEAAQLKKRRSEIGDIIKPLVTCLEAEAENIRKKMRRRGIRSSEDLLTDRGKKDRASGQRASPRPRLST